MINKLKALIENMCEQMIIFSREKNYKKELNVNAINQKKSEMNNHLSI